MSRFCGGIHFSNCIFHKTKISEPSQSTENQKFHTFTTLKEFLKVTSKAKAHVSDIHKQTLLSALYLDRLYKLHTFTITNIFRHKYYTNFDWTAFPQHGKLVSESNNRLTSGEVHPPTGERFTSVVASCYWGVVRTFQVPVYPVFEDKVKWFRRKIGQTKSRIKTTGLT